MTRPIAPLLRFTAIAALGLAVLACSSAGGTTSPAAPSPSIRPAPSFSARPTIAPSAAPITGEVPADVLTAVRAELSSSSGLDAANAEVVRAEAVDWPDGSMGCPVPGMMYTQQIVPGYQVVLTLDGKTYDYRVAAETGTIVRCEGLKPPSAS